MRALVTGGSAGLGRALCDALLDDGFDVISVDREAPSQKTEAKHIACDLSDRMTVDNLLDKLEADEAFDVVIFNAGISATGKFEDIEPEDHLRVFETNASAPMVCCAGLIKAGKIAEEGHIVFVASLSHFTGYPGASSYAASKDALAIYAKSILKPLKNKHKISVTTAFPGPLKTEHAARHAPSEADQERRMQPEEAARLILADMRKRKAKSLPGGTTALLAMAGQLAPKPLTFAMKQIIYKKLDRTVAD